MISYTPTPDFYNDYIAHHGVEGQKWGVQNGPPYPLDSKISTGKRLKKRSKDNAELSSTKVKEEVEVKEARDLFNSLVKSGKSPEKWSAEDYQTLQNAVRTVSGDWYNSKPVSAGFKKQLQVIKNIEDRAKSKHDEYFNAKRNPFTKKRVEELRSEWRELLDEKHTANSDLVGVALRDLGLPDTPENRSLMYSVVIWD